jgi:streptogramin lyase
MRIQFPLGKWRSQLAILAAISAAVVAGAPLRATAQIFTAFPPAPTQAGSGPWSIAAGPDGNLWFTMNNGAGSNPCPAGAANPWVERMTPAGVAAAFQTGSNGGAPMWITSGPDGNVWFTMCNVFVNNTAFNAISKVTADGVVTNYILTTNPEPFNAGALFNAITAGPDGNVWFTYGNETIGKISPTGGFTFYQPATCCRFFSGITAGPDGNLWITEVNNTPKIARFTPGTLAFVEFTIPSGNYGQYIAAGPDGNLWFSEPVGNQVGKVTTDGHITELDLGSMAKEPLSVTAGPDGNVWFTEVNSLNGKKIARITPGGAVTEFSCPIGHQNNCAPFWVTTGSDGNLWFTGACCIPGAAIGRLVLPPAAPLTSTHDFNGNGKSDILWYNTTSGQAVTWLVNGTSVTGGGSPGSMTSPWAVVGQRDFNGDSFADIVWRNSTTGQLLVWLINGATLIGSGSPGSAGSPWSVAGTGDFNGDGFGDVLWYNTITGQVVVWFLNGTSVIGGGSPGSAPSPWTIASAGDFNGDGMTDILWYNTSTGQTVIWLMNGASVIGGGSPGSAASPWTIAGTGDFNADGMSDILWLNGMSGQLVIWLINGTSVVGGGSPGSVASPWVLAQTGDFNADGRSDILWSNSSTGQLVVWLLNGTSVIGGGSPGSAASSWQIQVLNSD